MMHHAPTDDAPTIRYFGQPEPGSLGIIISAFKGAVTRRVHGTGRGMARHAPTRHPPSADAPEPPRPFWQRNFFEHIIRNERELEAIRQYIANNPAMWDKDQLHPNAPVNKFNQTWKRNPR
ncbi:MAG: hypothetical protein L0332_28195 [Chloroflexi bacterium]|nr:hypothetical protein [Chloroflexota bacterium]